MIPIPSPRFFLSALGFAALVATGPVPGALGADEKLSAVAQRQVDVLQAEKEGRTPAQHKMDSHLIFKAKKQRGERLGAELKAMEDRIVVAADGKEAVDIQADVTDALLAELKRMGADIVASVPQFKSIRARVPLKEMEALAARPEVRFIRPAVEARTHVGPATSEGDVTHRADAARQMLKATGRGIKIGVLSDSVDYLSQSQGLGELGYVNVLPGQSGVEPGSTGEGTAMLEIIHDLAPDAELFFATANPSAAQFAQNILDLRAAGCDIIVDDVGYFDESPFQDGIVAQAVEQVVASGALYFSAAGNSGSKARSSSQTWEGDFVDGGPTGPEIVKAGRLHSFGTQTYNTVVDAGFDTFPKATLFWSDPLNASHNDYDLYVFDATGKTILDFSTTSQNGTQDPYEIVDMSTDSRLVIVKSPSAKPCFLHLSNLSDGSLLENGTTGSIRGHAGAAAAIAVAAVDAQLSYPNPFTTNSRVRVSSTDGDRHLFYYADGTPITPGNFLAAGGLIRRKPDMAAATGVTTSVPGFAPFYGTSAAAPHAAAIAAQVWSRNRQLTPQQVRNALTSTALDIEGVGQDGNSGAGLLDALAAAQSVAGGPIIQPDVVTITGESFTPANGAVDPGEIITVALPLQNIGAATTTNLVARLLPTGGVSNPTTQATYGALASNASATRNYSFQANGKPGDTITLTFVLSDGNLALGSATASFAVGALGPVQTFANSGAITIRDDATALPYPAAINVSGVTGGVGRVSVTLQGVAHTFPSDVDVLLVSPSGRKVMLLSRTGGGTDVSGLDLTFDDNAAGKASSPLATGTYQPSATATGLATSLPAGAPAAPYADLLSTFNGDNPNGAWQLFVNDHSPGDSGAIASGWTLRITPTVPSATSGPNPDLVPVLQQSTTQLSIGEAIVYTATVYNYGSAAANNVVLTDTLPAALTFGQAQTTAGTVTNAGNTVTANLGTLASGQSAVVTITAVGVGTGSVTNTVNVSLTGTENNTANNSAGLQVLVGQPNLFPVALSGWGSKVNISKITGSVIDAASITPADPLFLDFAYVNAGFTPAHGYFTSVVTVDGVVRRTVTRQLVMGPGAIDTYLDLPIGTFPPGVHTVQVKIDSADDVPESNETDNVYTRTFTVQGPNLAPVKPAGWSDVIVVSRSAGTNTDSVDLTTDDALFLDRALVNNGVVPVPVAFNTQLYVDGVLRTTWTTPAGLSVNGQDRVEDFALGTLTPGVHRLRVVTDSDGVVAETSEADNEATKTILIGGVLTLTGLTDQMIAEEGTTGALPFTVGPGGIATSSLAFALATSNPALVPATNITFGGTGANRTVTVVPAPNQVGSSTITVTVSDGNGGLGSASFAVQVTPVNDAPSFTKGPDVSAAQDAGPQMIPRWATNLSAGPADEAAQILSFTVTADKPALFAVQPAISAAGTLTFSPAPQASGTAVVTVTLHDNGGAGGGHVDTAPAQSFAIHITSLAEELGTYNGLVQPVAGDVLENERAGLIKVTISKGGGFSGKLTLLGKALTIMGSFDNAGVARFGKSVAPTFTIVRAGLPDLLLSLAVDVAGGTNKLTGNLTKAGAPFAVIDADRALFTSTILPAAPLQNVPPAWLGSYTVLFAAKTPAAQGRPTAEFPQGDGVGTLKVDAKGNATLVGTLADGTKVSYANAIALGGAWPLYVPVSKGAGSLSGSATFRPHVGVSDLDGQDLHWFKAAGLPPYPAGWTTGILTDLFGSKHNPANLTGFQGSAVDGNAQVTFVDGGFAAPGLRKAVNFTLLPKVSVIKPETDKLTLTYKKSDGTVSGTFVPAIGAKSVKVSGVFFQDQGAVFGYFIRGNESGSFTLVPAVHPVSLPAP
ncbi:MAG TPA: CARDB domain-containing protein [Chthoniobacteraceae bacterium]|jgi:uncharacterized repeat protein (TIGR01451 family)|nr:CARDB domain-containing protein [Chthoniobacteraceae bacterium]